MKDEQESFDEVGCGGLREGPEHSACASVGERVTGVAGALVQTGLAFEFYLVTTVYVR